VKLLQCIILGACFLWGTNGLARVIINSPSNGATVSSPVQLSARSSGPQPTSISVYVNNALVTEKNSAFSITTPLILAPGDYTIKVLARYGRRSSSSAVATITVPSSGGPSGPTPPPSNSTVAAQLSADMQGGNEGYPHGVPRSYDWANGPVIEMGNDSTGWVAIEAWGLVYEAAEGNKAVNTRVNIRNLRLLFLKKSTRRWLVLQNTSKPIGAAYVEDFSNDANIPARIRNEPDGTISVTAGGGYCFHFYPADRVSINPDDIGGIVVVYETRLITADPSKPDDRGSARYVANAGADYYPGLTGGCPVGANGGCPGVAIGKMKYVQDDWRSIAMTTLTQSQIASNPPPVDLNGVLP
jgi:hypothetical protein